MDTSNNNNNNNNSTKSTPSESAVPERLYIVCETFLDQATDEECLKVRNAHVYWSVLEECLERCPNMEQLCISDKRCLPSDTVENYFLVCGKRYRPAVNAALDTYASPGLQVLRIRMGKNAPSLYMGYDVHKHTQIRYKEKNYAMVLPATLLALQLDCEPGCKMPYSIYQLEDGNNRILPPLLENLEVVSSRLLIHYEPSVDHKKAYKNLWSRIYNVALPDNGFDDNLCDYEDRKLRWARGLRKTLLDDFVLPHLHLPESLEEICAADLHLVFTFAILTRGYASHNLAESELFCDVKHSLCHTRNYFPLKAYVPKVHREVQRVETPADLARMADEAKIYAYLLSKKINMDQD